MTVAEIEAANAANERSSSLHKLFSHKHKNRLKDKPVRRTLSLDGLALFVIWVAASLAAFWLVSYAVE